MIDLLFHFAVVIGVFAIVLGIGVITSRATGINPVIVFGVMVLIFWALGELVPMLNQRL